MRVRTWVVFLTTAVLVACGPSGGDSGGGSSGFGGGGGGGGGGDECVPACDDRDCGNDDCGDFCGECTEEQLCDAVGVCLDAADCTDTCDDKDCGTVCGEECGTCDDKEICTADFQCKASSSGGGGGSTPDVVDGPDAGGVTGDGTGNGASDVPPVDNTKVTYIGLEGLDGTEGVLCGGTSIKVQVQAVDIGERTLGLAIVEGSKVSRLPVTAEATGSDDMYIFTLNTEPFQIPEEGVPDTEGLDPAVPADAEKILQYSLMLLEDGKSFDLMAIAFDVSATGEDVLPTEDKLKDKVKLYYDLSPPTLTVTEPNPSFELQTISGYLDMAGLLNDSQAVGRVEVAFDGNVLATFLPDEDSNGKQFAYEGVADLRYESTDIGTLSITGYDACGFSQMVSIQTKLIAWPWLRTFPRFLIPGNQTINDSAVVDWNKDGFPDVLFATQKGIWVAQNDALGPEEPVQFSKIEALTDVQSDAIALVDLDGDGNMDIVSVSRLGAAGKGLLVLRNPGPGWPLQAEESHILPIASTTQIRGLVAADFDPPSGDDDNQPVRHEVIVVTSSQEESLLVYKRLGDGELVDDLCVEGEKEVPDESEGAAEGATITVPTQTCPSLFTDSPAISGGIEEITQVTVMDVTGGQNDGPDGYPDLVVGADQVNQIYVYPNRFAQSGLLDTAFSTAEGSYVWPVSSSSLERTRHFCLGHMVVVEGEDGVDTDSSPPEKGFIDLVVGTEYSGTWRTLVGKGDGTFYNEPPANGVYSDLDIYSMSGTVGNTVNALLCADLNMDGDDDFLIISADTKTLQVHLGNGLGRYNQLEDSPLLNPINEPIGFAIDRFAGRPHIDDFDNDGYPDIMVDFRLGSFTVLTNRMTDEDDPFDLEATRVLVTPLGKTSQATGGLLDNMAIGDLTGDNVPDIIAMTENKTFSKHQWIGSFHPIGSSYRAWVDDTKIKRSPTFFVWSSANGTYGDFEPSFPAAYDRFPKLQYGGLSDLHGATNAREMKLVDIANPNGGVFDLTGDAHLDVVITGPPAGGNPQSHLSVFVNMGQDLWNINLLTQATNGSFVPLNGAESVLTTPESFTFFTPPGYNQPGIFMPTNGGVAAGLCTSLSPIMRFCPWNPNAKDDSTDPPLLTPYWDCWHPLNCESTVGTKFGGQAKRVVKLSIEEGAGGVLDESPDTPGDLLVVSSGGENLTLFRYNDSLDDYPSSVPLSWPIAPNQYWFFDEPQHLAVGKNPVDVAVGDIDGDGHADIVAAVQKNVMLGFGDDQNPYESFQPVDKRPGYEQSGGVANVVLSDVNNDTFLDVVFTETSTSNVTIYLAVGTDPILGVGADCGDGECGLGENYLNCPASQDGDCEEGEGKVEGYRRQYHGPITIPVCSQPSVVKAVDFDSDGCDTLVVLCEGAGAVATIQNDTCPPVEDP